MKGMNLTVKKIISFIITLAVVTNSIIVFASDSSEQKVTTLLSVLNIMKGDENGNLNLAKKVSRAEFTKMCVASSSHKNSVATGLKISSYKDVPATYWAAPYIKVGVDNGLCKGYTDSTFRPNNTVKYEEAVTMLLRILGYTDDDFGNSWPYGQVGLAENLGISDNADVQVGEELTRQKVAILVYNTLNTKMKNSSQKLISIFDIEKIEDVVLISVNDTWEKEIYTSKGSFKADEYINSDLIGKRGDLYLENGDTIAAFIPDDNKNDTEKHIVYSMLDNNIITYNNGVMNTLTIPVNTVVYEKDIKSTYAAKVSEIEMGDILHVKRQKNNDPDYIIYENGNIEGPFTVTSEYDFQKYASAKVLQNGEISTIDKLKKNDIIYYVPDLNAIFSYSNKVVGIYENAEPNKDAPIYVTVSGKRYKVESGTAFEKLSSAGNLKYGDTVTLLLGKTNDIADVFNTSTLNDNIYGYLYETGTKEYIKNDLSKYTSMYIKIAMPDGQIQEYQTDKNYNNYKNSIRKIIFENGKAKAENVNTDNNISGTFNWGQRTLGSMKLSNDLKILDISTLDSNKVGNYITVFPERLDGVKITSGNILHYEKNDMNQIDSLILNNVTGDMYSYGIVKKAENNSNDFFMAGVYTFDINGVSRDFSSVDAIYSVESGQAAMFDITSSGNIQSIKPITMIKEKITDISKTSLKAGNNRYKISDNVSVYKKDFDNNYTIIPINDIIDNNNYSLSGYYDKNTASGGLVRIIVAKEI